MGRKHYLFDTSAAKYFYLSPPNEEAKKILAYLTAQRIKGEAVFYIPIFCITELFNLLAREHYRHKRLSKADFDGLMADVRKQVRHRDVFYPLDVTRYHNYDADHIYPIEHTTETEYHAAGLSAPQTEDNIRAALRGLTPPKHPGMFYLSAPDILILCMGMELCRTLESKEVCILTADRRLAQVGTKTHSVGVPRIFDIYQTRLTNIEAFQTGRIAPIPIASPPKTPAA